MRFIQLVVCTFIVCLAGCSAVIDPDERRLGGADGGVSAVDGGDNDDGGDDGGGSDDGGTVDGGPMCPPSCDDDVACTDDMCIAGVCDHAPQDAACSDTERCSPVLGCVPMRCTRNEECDDGMYCTGEERCDADAEGTGCVDGDPVTCDDGFSCTDDACDDTADACAFTPVDSACGDGVDCTVDRCDPDASSSDDMIGCVHEVDDAMCATDFCVVGSRCDATTGCSTGTPRNCADATPCTIDTCSGGACVNTLRDDDMDGFGPIDVPGADGSVVMCGGTDCNDAVMSIAPGATEHCNTIDDNCDGRIDEGCPVTLPDTCRTPNQIVLDASGRGTANGTFSAFFDDYRAGAICSPGMGGRDAVYYIDLPRGASDVVIDTIGSTADTILAVGFECSMTGFNAACNDDYDQTSVTTSSRIWVHRFGSALASTRLYILVDSYSSSTSGTFVLNVNRNAVGNDSCPVGGGSQPLDITGGGTVLGYQAEVIGGERGTCQPAFDASGEAVFRVRGPSSGDVDFDVYSVDFVPDVYLRNAPCGSGTERECIIGSSIGGGLNRAHVEDSVTDGTLYYLFVDGGRGSYAVYYKPF